MNDDVLMCPKCGQWAQLATRELIPAVSQLNAVVRLPDGTALPEHGDSEIDYDGSRTQSVFCRAPGCGFEYAGADWLTQLKERPSLPRVVEAIIGDAATTGDGPSQAGAQRVVTALVTGPRGKPGADPRATLLVEMLHRTYEFPDEVETLYSDVLSLLPTAQTAVGG